MSKVFDGTKKVVIPSAHTPEYVGKPEFAINPTLPAIAQEYMKVVNGQVVEMTAQEKAVVDAQKEEMENKNAQNVRIKNKLRELALDALGEEDLS